MVAILLLFGGMLGAGYVAWRMGILPDFRPPLNVETVLSGIDANMNGIDDSLDIVTGARAQVRAETAYKSAYYQGGYPPEAEGVCTDLVWRALGVQGTTSRHLWTGTSPRQSRTIQGSKARLTPTSTSEGAQPLRILLEDFHIPSLPRLSPGTPVTPREWQPGDMVIFGRGCDHIGIVSDRRLKNGIPLIIHHGWGHPVEDNALGYLGDQIAAHFRLDLKKIETR